MVQYAALRARKFQVVLDTFHALPRPRTSLACVQDYPNRLKKNIKPRQHDGLIVAEKLPVQAYLARPDAHPKVAAHLLRRSLVARATRNIAPRSYNAVSFFEMIDDDGYLKGLGGDYRFEVFNRLSARFAETPELDPFRQIHVLQGGSQTEATRVGADSYLLLNTLNRNILRGALALKKSGATYIADFMLIEDILWAAMGDSALELVYGITEDNQSSSEFTGREFNLPRLHGEHLVSATSRLSRYSDHNTERMWNSDHDINHLLSVYTGGFQSCHELIVFSAIVVEAAYQVLIPYLSGRELGSLDAQLAKMAEFQAFDSYKRRKPDHIVSNMLYGIMLNFLYYAGINSESRKVLSVFCKLVRRMIKQKIKTDPRVQDVDLFREAYKEVDLMKKAALRR
jgi:hypothetical protein